MWRLRYMLSSRVRFPCSQGCAQRGEAPVAVSSLHRDFQFVQITSGAYQRSTCGCTLSVWPMSQHVRKQNSFAVSSTHPHVIQHLSISFRRKHFSKTILKKLQTRQTVFMRLVWQRISNKSSARDASSQHSLRNASIPLSLLWQNIQVETNTTPARAYSYGWVFLYTGTEYSDYFVFVFPTGERPYQCPHCPKAFRQEVHLANHIRLHTGEKPFVCTYCNKAFAHKNNLMIHIKIHTGDKNQCGICGKGKWSFY